MRPARAMIWSTPRATDASDATSISTTSRSRCSSAASVAELLGGGSVAVGDAAHRGEHVVAGAGERLCDQLSEAAAAAGYQDDLRHSQSPAIDVRVASARAVFIRRQV